MIRNEKGVTIVALIVTIIVLLIIAGITIGNGMEGAEVAVDNKLLTELNMVQHAVLQRYTKVSLTKQDVPGDKIESYSNIVVEELKNEIKLKIAETDYTNLDKYEYYYKLNSEHLKDLGVTNTTDTYIVNYSTGEVINETQKKTKSGELLYVYAKSNTEQMQNN